MKGGGVCFMINHSWCDCDNIQKLTSFCSPDVEYLTIKWPYYIQREFSSVIVTAVYIPPQADTTTALKELRWTLCKLGTTYHEATFIVAWDFNQANLRKTLPKFYQHIDCSICSGKILDHCYSALKCLQGPYLPSLRQTWSRLHFAPPVL